MLGIRDVLFLAPSSSLHHQREPLPSSPALDFSLGVFPFLSTATATATAAANSLVTTSTNGGLIEESSTPFESDNHAKITCVCEDCGNRAKKGCDYRRCGTCCRSRRYDCTVHLTSTWIPAAVGAGGGSSNSSSGVKRPRLDGETKETLPKKIRARAVFRCIRVTAMNGGETKFAYQVTAKINDHVFKGIIHDDGVDHQNAFPCLL